MAKYSPFFTASLLLAFVPLAHAAPIHVSLKDSAMVGANADGFFTLGQIADLSGGDGATRTRMAAVSVGRAPLTGETRRLTSGDIALKLRQAGFKPDKDALLEGARQMAVTVADALPVANAGGGSQSAASPTPPTLGAGGPSSAPTEQATGPILIHPGDAVSIVVQSDALTITAKGVARQPGRAGDAIRVHREGVMTDLTVIVVDAQTVQLEI